MPTMAIIAPAAVLAVGACLLYARQWASRRKWAFQCLLCLVVFAAAVYLQLYVMPGLSQTADDFRGGAAKAPPPKKKGDATMAAIEKYRRFVSNMSGRKNTQQGDAVAVMREHQRVETRRYEQNTRQNDQFEDMGHLYAKGVGAGGAQAMSTVIHNDLEQSLMADRNTSAIKRTTFTDPAIVGEYNRGVDRQLDAVPQATGHPLRASTGLSAHAVEPGPRAMEPEKEKTEGRNAELVRSDAASTGLMSSGAIDEVSALFENPMIAAGEDGDQAMQEAIAAASAR